jgi:uncharacterized SAM-binding protein YcdF (DUF218 family)
MIPATNLIFAFLALGLLASGTRWAIPARRLATFSAAALCLIGVVPVGGWLLAPLEARFPSLAPGARPVAGIIVLGGGVSLAKDNGVYRPQPNEAVDRLFVSAELAHRYPAAKIVVSGGPIDATTGRAEADAVASYLTALGVAPDRMSLERRSANTAENARFSSALLHPAANQEWLLVTSAFHMPRAVGAFRRAGFTIRAVPADWRTTRTFWPQSWSASSNLKTFDLAAKEYLGLVVYRLRGDTLSFFPGP